MWYEGGHQCIACMPRLCVACTRGKRKLDECAGGGEGAAEQTRPFTPTAGMIRVSCLDAALQRQSGATRPAGVVRVVVAVV
eukprot:890979-Rhodomonas_salina.1